MLFFWELDRAIGKCIISIDAGRCFITGSAGAGSARRFLLIVGMRHYRRRVSVASFARARFCAHLLAIALGLFSGARFGHDVAVAARRAEKPWIAWSFLVLSSWPIARDWDARLFPDHEAQTAREQRRADWVLLREAGGAMRAPDERAFLAPWWMSPALAYWSRQPGVAGSSHESLPGILDSARFYLAATPAEAAPILRARQVRYLLASDADRIIANAVALLELKAPPRPMATLLTTQPHSVAPFLRPIFSNAFYKVFEVDPGTLPP